MRRKPYSVVLFDEIEKAHPQVFNIFLQLLDEGRLTDSKGVTVDFRNTILIMTSNLGSEVIKEFSDKDPATGSGQAKSELKKRDAEVWELLHRNFKPEFLNRLDSVIIYNNLSPKEIVEIAKIQLEEVKRRMQENNIDLKVTDDLAFYFAEIGYDPLFGARPLRRAIEEKLVDEIAIRIIDGQIKPGDTITPKIEKEKIVLD